MEPDVTTIFGIKSEFKTTKSEAASDKALVGLDLSVVNVSIHDSHVRIIFTDCNRQNLPCITQLLLHAHTQVTR